MITSQLVREHFEVMNTHAFPKVDETEIQDFTFKDNVNLCKTYGTDAIVVVAPQVVMKDNDDMFCSLEMIAQSWGYDVDGRDLGLAVQKSYRNTKKSCEGAFLDTIKELGYFTGRAVASALRMERYDSPRVESTSKGYN